MKLQLLEEAKRLYDLGFYIHWLRPKSKVPVRMGWSKRGRVSWEELKEEYQLGFNLGVCLGTPLAMNSKDVQKFLCVIDCDVKSTDPEHQKEMEEKLKEIWDKPAPTVLSGRGNGSRHLYLLTDTPVKARRIGQSSERVKVKLGEAGKATSAETKVLSAEEIKEGYRLRAAWEVSLLGEGQQVVLPPSIHPDSGLLYSWQPGLLIENGIPILQIEEESHAIKQEKIAGKEFERIENKAINLERLPTHTLDLIKTGSSSKAGNRSDDMFTVARAMLKEGYKDDEILSVLTDRGTYLGDAAWEKGRNGVEWVRKYTLEPAKKDVLPQKVFATVCMDRPILSNEEAEKQAETLTTPDDWRLLLEKTKNGGLKPSLLNVVTILKKEVGENLFIRDAFAIRDMYGMDSPWGGKKNAAMVDADSAFIKLWLSQKFGIEPPTTTILDAMINMCKENTQHPVRIYLNSLIWDQKPRLNTALKVYFEATNEPEYLAQVFRKFMVAAIARIMHPGSKFDWMLIFEGAQGIGKSTFPKIMAGDKWFGDWLPTLNDKDAAMGLQGIWFYEMGELSDLNKPEQEAAKAFITRTVDKFRPPYGRLIIELPRQCVFMGTTNKSEYLRDETGNRRFKPVTVGQLRFEELKRDRDQLFAEAKYLYESFIETGLELTGKAKEIETEIHGEKMIGDLSDFMVEEIQNLESALEEGRQKLPEKGLRLIDLFKIGGPLQKYSPNGKNIYHSARALKKYGFVSYKNNGIKMWKKK